MRPYFIALMVGVLGVAGCATGPDFEVPSLPSLANGYQYTSTSVDSPKVTWKNGDSEIGGAWWESLGSPTLNHWIYQALKNSPTATATLATLRQVEATVDAGESVLYPTVDLRAGATRQKTLTAPTVENSPTNTYTLYNAGVYVGYSFDLAGGLFGGARRAAEYRDAMLASAKFQAIAAMNTLAANVATTAINSAALQTQVTENAKVLTLQEAQLNRAMRQREIGAISDYELLPLKSNLANTRATQLSLQKQATALKNQLLVLIGEMPSAESLENLDLQSLSVPSEIPLLIPSEMVRRRPDIRAAESALQQANAAIGVASAGLYPQINITGSVSSQALSAGKLFDTTLWSVAGGISQALFRGGALTAQKEQAKAGYDMMLAKYQSTVLSSFANVSNALLALETDSIALKAQAEALTDSETVYSMAQKKYAIGVINTSDLLNAERSYRQSKTAYVQALAGRLSNIVALYVAAGGTVDITHYQKKE